MFEKLSDLITIRGHTLLCLQGFRGEGYDDSFVDCLTQIHQTLSNDPSLPVRVVQEPDDLCVCCPNLQDRACQLKGSDSETEMKAQDADVMARLEIEVEDTLPWREILDRIGRNIQGKELSDICGTCPWLPLGYCREGIEKCNKVVSV